MSTIANAVGHGITLGTAGSYTSPLTITAAGSVDNGGTGDAVYGPAGYAWTVANAGAISAAGTGNSGVNLLAGGYVGNSGQISGGYDGIYIGGAVGTVVNAGTVAATGTARYDDAIDLGQSGFAGYISNAGTGLITANGGAGIYAFGAASIVNDGTIQSTRAVGIVLGHGGQIVNSGSAALIVGYQYGIYAEKFADATIINSGTIAQTGTFFDAAIFFALGGVVTNGATNDTAALIAGYGWGIRGFGTAATTVNNFATIAAADGRAVELDSGVVVNGATNDGAALLGSRYSYGVEIDNTGTVINFATVTGGVFFDSTGVVVNGPQGATTALIAAGSYGGAGVEIGGGGTVDNFATIEAAGGAGRGVRLDHGGAVYNAASGLIAAPLYGVAIYGSLGTVVNLGTISEGGATRFKPAGIYASPGGVIVNGAAGGPTAMISGSEYGINVRYGSGIVSAITNFGTILATATNGYGVYIHSARSSEGDGSGIVVNAAITSLISGASYGAKARGSGGAVINFGTITASGSGFRDSAVYAYIVMNTGAAALISGYKNGVVLDSPGYLNNTGTIEAIGTAGIGVYSFGGTIVDSGTISGALHGITLEGGLYQHDRLVVEAGYKISGDLYSFTPIAYNDLELSGALGAVTASLDMLGTASFASVIFGPSGDATLNVSNTAGTLPVTISGFVAPTDAIDLTGIGGDGAISSRDAAHQRVTISGSLGSVTLQLDGSDAGKLVTVADGNGGTAVRPDALFDFDGDGRSDILWRGGDGNVAIWDTAGLSVVGRNFPGFADPAAWQIVGGGDFTGNGTTDILWQDTSGDVAMWQMNGDTIASSSVFGFTDPSWRIDATGDFDGDGRTDILWRNSDGNVAIWEMNGDTIAASSIFGFADPTVWSIKGAADFFGSGMSDILWQDTSGDVAIWEMNGFSVAASAIVGVADPAVWHIEGTGDFNGDGKSDILFQDNAGDLEMWQMNGFSITASTVFGFVDPSWHISGTGDYNGDGKSDILLRNDNGNVAVWELNGSTVAASAIVGFADPANWSIVPPDNTGDTTHGPSG